jgi:hypothetical protein
MSTYLKSLAKGQLRRASDARFRWLRMQDGRRALATLSRSDRGVPAALSRRAREDAIERLGNARHALWLTVYAGVCGEYRDGWIPDSYYLEEVMPRVNGVAHHLSRQSATNRALLDTPLLPDLAYVVNGRCLDRDGGTVPAAEVRELLADAGPKIVFKADHSGYGMGVRTIPVQDLTAEVVLRLGNGVIQRRITGHPVFDDFGVTSLATVRVATVLTPAGTAQARAVYLKIGRSGQDHVAARDQLRIAVDRSDGALASTGYTPDWRAMTRHPDTGAGFAGFKIPGLATGLSAVQALHEKLALPGFVCWDIAIDPEEQVHLLEWEGGVVIFAEPTQGPCFADLGWDRMHLSPQPKIRG